MEEAIKKIIEIEQEAQNLVAEGYAQAEKIRLDTDSELKAIEKNIFEMSEQKIEQLRAKNSAEASDRLAQIKENTTLRMQMLEKVAIENQELWENQIFNRVLGR